MDYSEFLFCMLLREYSDVFNAMPYDEMYDTYKPLYEEYEESVFNDSNDSEYDCMVAFLQSKDINDDLITLQLASNGITEERLYHFYLNYSKQFDNEESRELFQNLTKKQLLMLSSMIELEQKLAKQLPSKCVDKQIVGMQSDINVKNACVIGDRVEDNNTKSLGSYCIIYKY